MNTPTDTLTLYSQCLLSKWGFNDGDEPDAYLDWCDTNGHPYPDDWDTVLRTLVRTRLLPALDHRVELVDIETHHNPIRAERVDGVDVTDLWYNTRPGLTLTPESVEVPFTDVLALYACTCPDIDVSTLGEPPGTQFIKGLDARCRLHGKAAA